MNKLQIFLVLLFSFISLQRIVKAQPPLFSQYSFNRLIINPAFGGINDVLHVTAIARRQWVGIEGAPNSEIVTADAPLRQGKMGLGLIVLHNEWGIVDHYESNCTYSYRIELSPVLTLSAGLKVGFTNINQNFALINTNIADPIIPQNNRSIWDFNFGAGIYLESEVFFAGISLPYLIDGRQFQDNRPGDFIFNSGALIPLNPYFKFRPSLLFFWSEEFWQFDLNASMLYRDMIWFGLSFRWLQSVDFLVQFRATEQLQIGYSYDLLVNDLRKSGNGSHEIMLSFRFLFSKSKVISPRYF